MLQLLQTALLFAFPALVIVAGMRDAVSFTIPNWISLGLIAAFVPAAAVSGASLPVIGLCLATGFGARMILGGFACLLHGIFPFLFVKTGSAQISTLHERMVRNRQTKQMPAILDFVI